MIICLFDSRVNFFLNLFLPHSTDLNFPFLELLQSFIFPFLYHFFLFAFYYFSPFSLFFLLSPPPPQFVLIEFLSYIFVYLLISKHSPLFMFYCETASEDLTLQQALLQVSSSFLVLFPLYLSFHCIFVVI